MINIGLIILNYNSAYNTINCVKQLLSFNESYHILVVDNCSTDDSFSILCKEFERVDFVDVIKNKTNSGYSAGNNFGIKYAIEKYGIEIVGILNPDVIIPKADVIKGITDALLSDDSFAIGSGIALNANHEYNINNSCWKIPTNSQLVLNHFLGKKRNKYTQCLKTIKNEIALTECVAGCFFLAKVSAMEKIGFFDDNVFLYNEENILGIKCKQQGFKEIIVLNQIYIHNHEFHKNEKVKFKKKMSMTKNSFESRKYLCKKYYNKLLLILLYIIEFLNRVYLFLAYIKNRFKK